MRPLSLTDGRLVLRPPRPADVDAVLRACQDPDIARWTTVPAPYTRRDAEDWVLRIAPLSWERGSHLVWYVVPPDEPDRLLASIALHHLDLEHHNAEIGFWAAPEARGRGVMTDAVRLLTRWGFDALELERIDWLAGVGNDGSRRVAEKAGFTIEGTTRGRLRLAGTTQDAWIGGLLAGETTGEALPITATPVDDLATPPTPDEDAARPWLALREVEITAGSLHLRPWHEGDVDALVRAIADPDIAHWNPFTREGTPEEDAVRFVERRSSDTSPHVALAVVDATTGEVLGNVALHRLDRGAGTGEIGYWTMPDARGRGVARQAIGTATRWAFGALGLERLDLFHAVGNEASCRVAEAAGFAREATLRRSYVYAGVRQDEHLHGRLATDPTVS